MKNVMKAVAALMLIMAVVYTTGCKKPDDPSNGDNENNSEIINPNYVPIDWDNATLLSANDSIGDYQIQFNGEMPELQPGSIITIDQDTVVRHIFIEAVDVNGNAVNITSTEAYLTDIFADTDFTLATNENSKSRSQGKVFFPTGIYQRGDDGTFHRIEMKSTREDGWGFTHDLWQITGNFDGQVIHSSDNHSIYMEKLNYNVDIDLEMYFNFSGRDVHEIVGNALDRYRSEALNINAYLLGSFDTEQRLRCDIRGNCSYNHGYDIWKHNLFRPLRVRFVVLGVPVIITLNSDLYRQVQVNANGEISTYMGFVDNANGRLGFEWHQSGGMEPVDNFTNTFELTPPTVEGKGSIVGKVWAFPRIRLLLYDLIGPSFDIKPYLSTTLSGGFKEEMLGQSNDFCAWSLDCNTGLDACCGLSLQFMGYEVENYSTQDKNIIDQPLYHSPLRIEHNAKGNGMKIGQRNEVSFMVYDRNHLFNTEVVTPLPQFVKFEGDGDISSEYGIVQGGTVAVDWTPLHDSDVLYARLYDIDGNVISEAEVGAEITVTTLPVTNIGQTTATGGGEITANEYMTVEERGLCWNTAGAPTIGDSHANSGTGTGNYMVNMTGLTASTTYHVRAYAYFGGEFYYGNEMIFTTKGDVPVGAINGLYTVNDNGDQVYFSQGNLQYQASTGTWRFSENQHDMIGNANGSISQNYSGWIDLFGWGTSGYNHGAICYQPWSTSTSNSDYYAYGNIHYNLYDQNGKSDWGYNAIFNGGNAEGVGWYTLTQTEWNYVFNGRNTTSGILYAKANVSGVNGVILLPDNWTVSIYMLNNTNSGNCNYNSNTISSTDWVDVFEANGAVFLPASGWRRGSSIYRVNDHGNYRSASSIDGTFVYGVDFDRNHLYPNAYDDRRDGLCVRLVCNAE